MIKGKKIFLREVEYGDADTILMWENTPEFWNITENEGPFTLQEIHAFINESKGLKSTGQIRYMILNYEEIPIGAIDLFGYNAAKQSAGIGILIADNNNRAVGFATDALSTLVNFLMLENSLKELRCIIYPENIASINLFLRCGFSKTGADYFKGRPVKCFSKQI